ncbi:MAG: hypothetical protein R3B07_29655 [Polyangiaceae bacterium]
MTLSAQSSGTGRGGAKLSLLLLGAGLLATWLVAPNFFRGRGGGVCGLSLKYGAELTDVTVQRVDRRDEPRSAGVEKPLAVPCGEDLEVSYTRVLAPRASASAAPEPAPLREQTRIPAARLRTGSVVQVELR